MLIHSNRNRTNAKTLSTCTLLHVVTQKSSSKIGVRNIRIITLYGKRKHY